MITIKTSYLALNPRPQNNTASMSVKRVECISLPVDLSERRDTSDPSVCVSRVAAITSVQIYERADRRVVLDFSPAQSATITLADN